MNAHAISTVAEDGWTLAHEIEGLEALRLLYTYRADAHSRKVLDLACSRACFNLRIDRCHRTRGPLNGVMPLRAWTLEAEGSAHIFFPNRPRFMAIVLRRRAASDEFMERVVREFRISLELVIFNLRWQRERMRPAL